MRHPLPWALFILAFLLGSSPPAALSAKPVTARPATIQGRVIYRTGTERVVKPDARAKVWVFRGREALALRSLEKLRQFEQTFPQGLTRAEDRPKENETRMSAMVLMTYDTVHRERLQSTLPLAADGSFQFSWDRKEPITVVVESAATMGSYHMPRYAVRVLEPARPPGSLVIDFGVSHLENHPAAAGNEGTKDEGVKG